MTRRGTQNTPPRRRAPAHPLPRFFKGETSDLCRDWARTITGVDPGGPRLCPRAALTWEGGVSKGKAPPAAFPPWRRHGSARLPHRHAGGGSAARHAPARALAPPLNKQTPRPPPQAATSLPTPCSTSSAGGACARRSGPPALANPQRTPARARPPTCALPHRTPGAPCHGPGLAMPKGRPALPSAAVFCKPFFLIRAPRVGVGRRAHRLFARSLGRLVARCDAAFAVNKTTLHFSATAAA
jgi:hypothetical protein